MLRFCVEAVQHAPVRDPEAELPRTITERFHVAARHISDEPLYRDKHATTHRRIKTLGIASRLSGEDDLVTGRRRSHAGTYADAAMPRLLPEFGAQG